jgi:hypothetical protein
VAAAFGALDGTVKGLQPSLHLAACSYPAPGAADGLSFVPQRGVTYALISAATHQAVTAGKTTVSGEADLNLAPLHSTLDQLFTFHGVGNSGSTLSYQLRSYQTGGHLAAGNSTSGLTLSVPGGAGLTWQVLPSVSGDFVLRADGQRCLEVESPNQQVIRLLPIKKGMTNTGNWNAALTHIKPTWTYNWGTSTQNDVSKIEFVPMIWGLWMNGTTLTKTVATLKEQGARHVLTYNEPDNASQSNVAVKAAANSWTHLVAGGLPLGSPATVSAVDPWMQTFMAKVPHSDVQFVTVHWYGGPSAQSLVDGLKEVHALYKLPIWITEFAPADWHAKVPGDIAFSQDQVAGFVQELLPKLDLLPFVQRYAWFEGGESDAALGHSTLLDAEGNMTPAGKIYGAYPLPPV